MSKVCPVCETENSPGAKNCDLCGEPLAAPLAAAPPPAPALAAPAPAPQPTGAATQKRPQASLIDASDLLGPDLSDLSDLTDLAPAPAPAPTIAASAPAPAPAIEDDLSDLSDLSDLPDLPGLPGSPDVSDTSPRAATTPEAQQAALDDLAAFEALLAAAEAPAPTPASTPAPAPIAAPTPTPAPVAAPTPSASAGSAALVVYFNRQPAHRHEVAHDETLIGRADPTTNTFPDLDLTPYDPSQSISRRHARLLREGGAFFLQPLSASGTQVGSQLVELGARQPLSGGEVVVLGGRVAIKFERAAQPEAPKPQPAAARRLVLVVYFNRQPAHRHEVAHDETLIGRADPTTNTFPDLDLTPYDPSQSISRRHARLLREGGAFFLQPLSASGTQVGGQLVELGARQQLSGGEVVVLGGRVAIKVEVV